MSLQDLGVYWGCHLKIKTKSPRLKIRQTLTQKPLNPKPTRVAQLNTAYQSLAADMVGFARLNRGPSGAAERLGLLLFRPM